MPAKAYTMLVKVTDDELLNGTFQHRHRLPRRLVLCFDGTGNSFQGNASDTNIVKLLDMFDHTSVTQKHYYQRKRWIRTGRISDTNKSPC